MAIASGADTIQSIVGGVQNVSRISHPDEASFQEATAKNRVFRFQYMDADHLMERQLAAVQERSDLRLYLERNSAEVFRDKNGWHVSGNEESVNKYPFVVLVVDRLQPTQVAQEAALNSEQIAPSFSRLGRLVGHKELKLARADALMMLEDQGTTSAISYEDRTDGSCVFNAGQFRIQLTNSDGTPRLDSNGEPKTAQRARYTAFVVRRDDQAIAETIASLRLQDHFDLEPFQTSS